MNDENYIGGKAIVLETDETIAGELAFRLKRQQDKMIMNELANNRQNLQKRHSAFVSDNSLYYLIKSVPKNFKKFQFFQI